METYQNTIDDISIYRAYTYIPGIYGVYNIQQYFGEIKNELFLKNDFFFKIQKTLIHVAHVLPRVILIGYA